MADTVGQFGARQSHRFIDLLRLVLLEMVCRRLHLDMRAEQGGHMRGIGGDVERRFARLRQPSAARIGPEHDGKARASASAAMSWNWPIMSKAALDPG